jgi:large subunit ribosomal protein L25
MAGFSFAERGVKRIMNEVTLSATKRDHSTKGDRHKLRREGYVPANVFGTGLQEPISLVVQKAELTRTLAKHANGVITLQVTGGESYSVMIDEIQREPIKGAFIHVDFHQIDLNQEINTKVRLDISADAAGVKDGGIQQILLYELEVRVLASNIPESIPVDMTNVGIGESVTVADLTLPEGVTTTVDGDTVIVTILAPQNDLPEEEAKASEEGVADAAAEESGDKKES